MKRYEEQQLRIYNSLSQEKEIFKPITEGYVGMYVCGPTVYSNVHLGNCRTFLSFDLVFRYLKHLDYKVRYVRNITDAGHLENDDDQSEDKIAKKARVEQIEPMEVVQKYTIDFHDILKKLNLLPPSIEPTATGHIIEQIEITKKIMDKGLAYESNGSIYFDVIKYNETSEYGILSKRNLEDMIANTRVLSGQSEKKNPQDFALWKKAEPEHIMRWSSPWGEGFPGWHLECTAMSTKYLGEQFDIHGGGMDLKFPHHECEIAQAHACEGNHAVNIWMHANMLTLNGQKMSKSTGNSILPNELFDNEDNLLGRKFSPNVVRFFILQAHYRSILDFSGAALEASEKGYNRLIAAINTLKDLKISAVSSIDISEWKQKCYNAMNDDFNSPILIANLFEGVKYIHLIKDGKETINKSDFSLLKETIHNFVYDVMGLTPKGTTQNIQKLNGTIDLLIQLRKEARENKNWALSDQIRDKLADMGILLKDGKDGTSFSLK